MDTALTAWAVLQPPWGAEMSIGRAIMAIGAATVAGTSDSVTLDGASQVLAMCEEYLETGNEMTATAMHMAYIEARGMATGAVTTQGALRRRSKRRCTVSKRAWNTWPVRM